MSTDRDFDDLRRDPDPLRRGRRATELITRHTQLNAELARIRRQAVDAARTELNMTFTDIAPQMGLTKARLSQVMKTAPAAERLIFGIGPVTIGVPYRYQTTDRARPLIAAEDAETAELVAELLGSLSFETARDHIDPSLATLPSGDAVIICGPKSAPVAASLLAADPALRMVEHDQRWWIEEVATGERHGSPTDDEPTQPADIAYVARQIRDGRVVVHIAGIHAIGSLGAAYYLQNNLAELFATTQDAAFSMIIRSSYDGLHIIASDLVAGPVIW